MCFYFQVNNLQYNAFSLIQKAIDVVPDNLEWFQT